MLADVVAHLHGGLRDAGDLAAVLLEVSEVAEHENFGEAGRIQIGIDNDTAALVEGGTQHFAQG